MGDTGQEERGMGVFSRLNFFQPNQKSKIVIPQFQLPRPLKFRHTDRSRIIRLLLIGIARGMVV